MLSTSDTIVAIATPAGRGGLGVVRLSGPEAARIAGELVGRTTPFIPRHATFGRYASPASRRALSGVEGPPSCPEGSRRDHAIGDQVVVTVFPAPASYTSEDVAEVSAHGSPVVLAAILASAVHAGARLAEPGEFTLRAFLHGKIDLVQAEAVADLINAVTPLQARAAFDQLEGTLTQAIGAIERELFDVMARLEASLDFPEEGYHFIEPSEAAAQIAVVSARIDTLLRHSARGRLIREGAQVALVGSPNVGKSSLFNALLNADRAIVTPVPGTTRDLVTERADIGGLSLSLVDTAGVRETTDIVEQEGVLRSREAIKVADLVLVVLDHSRSMGDEDSALLRETAGCRRLLVANKSDLAEAWQSSDLASACASAPIEISARTGAGLDRLVLAMSGALAEGESSRDRPAVTNVRHTVLLQRASTALRSAAAALSSGAPEEFPLVDLHDAADALQEVTGRRANDDLLRHIFEKFCIGK